LGENPSEDKKTNERFHGQKPQKKKNGQPASGAYTSRGVEKEIKSGGWGVVIPLDAPLGL